MSWGGSLELLADGLYGRGAGGSDGGSTAEVGVDAGEHLAVVGLDVLDNNAARDAVLAVTTSAVKLAEILKNQRQYIKHGRGRIEQGVNLPRQ